MGALDSRPYRALEVFMNFLLLNLLWLVACLPIVTLFPATAGMFGVVREWVGGEEAGFFHSFVRRFRENFKQSFWLGIVWSALGGLLAFDFRLLFDLPFALQIPLFPITALWITAYAFTSIYLFPVMVTYHLRWHGVIKNSFLLSMSQLGRTLACLVIIGFAALLFFLLPQTAVLTGSTTAYFVYRLINPVFARVEREKRRAEEGDQGQAGSGPGV